MDVIKKVFIFIEFLNSQQKNFSLARVILKFHGLQSGFYPRPRNRAQAANPPEQG